MKPADEQLLRDAIARNAGAVVSLPSASDGALRHHKTRLLAADDVGFWVEAPAGEREAIDELIAKGSAVGFTIRNGVTKSVMSTCAKRFEQGMRVSAELTVDAVLLAWPGEVRSIQRRASYRATVTPGAGVSARAWRVPDHHVLRDKPPREAEVPATLRDLSVGGMSVVSAAREGADRLEAGQRLRVVLSHPEGELLVDGRIRHVVALPGGTDVRVGVQFKKLEDDIEGRQTLATLTHIVGQLQRDDVRRHRLGMARSA